MNRARDVRMPARLRGWDYTSVGAYFITVCTYDRRPVLAAIDGTHHAVTPLGDIARAQLRAQCEAAGVALDSHVVMPDHLHFIVRYDGAGRHAPPLQALVTGFKADVTRVARRQAILTSRQSFWQRGFYDRIIRSEKEYGALAEYIATNPQRWTLSRTR